MGKPDISIMMQNCPDVRPLFSAQLPITFLLPVTSIAVPSPNFLLLWKAGNQYNAST